VADTDNVGVTACSESYPNAASHEQVGCVTGAFGVEEASEQFSFIAGGPAVPVFVT